MTISEEHRVHEHADHVHGEGCGHEAVPHGDHVGLPARQLQEIAKHTYGWPYLRHEQLVAAEAVVAGNDILVVMPSGAGKSAIYQVAALLMDGPTVVVSPLIALQRDQLESLTRSDAPPAVLVNSAQTGSAVEEAWAALQRGDATFVFLAPEQLTKQKVLDRLAALKPALLVIDEAHCVSSWGHDFRPDYLNIGDAIQGLRPRPVVLGLTATATPPVRQEIIERMHMRSAQEVICGFDRPNLALQVVRCHDAGEQRAAVIERAAIGPHPGLVYAGTRRGAEEIAADLGQRGPRAAAYHAGLKAGERRGVHQRWLGGELDIVAATSAFGMGVDKPNVRFVLHATVSGSLESYYQAIGRAGRDGEPADAVLFYRPEDFGMQHYFNGHRPDSAAMRKVATVLDESDEPTSPQELANQLHLSRHEVANALNALEAVDAVVAGDGGAVSRGAQQVPVEQGMARAEGAVRDHQQMEESRIAMMRGYAETTGCRRQFMLGYFGEQLAQACGNCDTCWAGADSEKPSGEFPVHLQVRHPEWGTGQIMRSEHDRVTVLFERVGYKTLALDVVRDNDLLQRSGA